MGKVRIAVIALTVAALATGVVMGRSGSTSDLLALTDEERACVMADAREFFSGPLEKAALVVGGFEVIDRTRTTFTVSAHTLFRRPFAGVRLSGCHGRAKGILAKDLDKARYPRIDAAYERMKRHITAMRGVPRAQYRPDHYLPAYPGLLKQDFDGVGSNGGTYRFDEDRLKFDEYPKGTQAFHEDGELTGAVGRFDLAKLLDNITARTGISWADEAGVTRMLEYIERAH